MLRAGRRRYPPSVAEPAKTHREWVRAPREWLAAWSKKPRYTLDWHYNHREYLLVVVAIVALILGGLEALTGIDRHGSPLLGLLALCGGLALLAVVVTYVRRPTKPRPKTSSLREDLDDLQDWSRPKWRRLRARLRSLVRRNRK